MTAETLSRCSVCSKSGNASHDNNRKSLNVRMADNPLEIADTQPYIWFNQTGIVARVLESAMPVASALGKVVNERSLRRHRDPSLSGKLLRMMTAMQAFRWCHQYSIADLLIGRDMGCELFTSGLDASRFAPAVRFGQSFHLGIHAHIQPHYGMAMYLSQKIDQGRPNAY